MPSQSAADHPTAFPAFHLAGWRVKQTSSFLVTCKLLASLHNSVHLYNAHIPAQTQASKPEPSQPSSSQIQYSVASRSSVQVPARQFPLEFPDVPNLHVGRRTRFNLCLLELLKRKILGWHKCYTTVSGAGVFFVDYRNDLLLLLLRFHIKLNLEPCGVAWFGVLDGTVVGPRCVPSERDAETGSRPKNRRLCVVRFHADPSTRQAACVYISTTMNISNDWQSSVTAFSCRDAKWDNCGNGFCPWHPGPVSRWVVRNEMGALYSDEFY